MCAASHNRHPTLHRHPRYEQYQHSASQHARTLAGCAGSAGHRRAEPGNGAGWPLAGYRLILTHRHHAATSLCKHVGLQCNHAPILRFLLTILLQRHVSTTPSYQHMPSICLAHCILRSIGSLHPNLLPTTHRRIHSACHRPTALPVCRHHGPCMRSACASVCSRRRLLSATINVVPS